MSDQQFQKHENKENKSENLQKKLYKKTFPKQKYSNYKGLSTAYHNE